MYSDAQIATVADRLALPVSAVSDVARALAFVTPAVAPPARRTATTVALRHNAGVSLKKVEMIVYGDEQKELIFNPFGVNKLTLYHTEKEEAKEIITAWQTYQDSGIEEELKKLQDENTKLKEENANLKGGLEQLAKMLEIVGNKLGKAI
jgi:hypothetical protein